MTKPRSASLRVAHASSCANRNATALDSLKGCTCSPSYYTMYRDSTGRPIKSARVKDRRVAERALKKLQGELSEDRADLKRRKRVEFGAWVDLWEEALRLAGRKQSTIDPYMTSARYARETLAGYDLREIGNAELRRLVLALRERGQSDTTISKHLRHLSSCFQQGIAEDYIDVNPVSRFRAGFKLNVQPSQANYFTDGELQRLWAQLRSGLPHPKTKEFVVIPAVYPHLFRFAVATGARIGELVALRWGDVRLSDGPHGEVRIDKSWSDRYGESAPKTRKSIRTLHLTEASRRVLEDWITAVGVHEDNELVFPNSRGEHLSPANMNDRVLNPALAAAGIAKVGDGSPEPRSFHTFRHCYARLMLEHGQDLQWVADEMGHESTATTELIYGHWSQEARRAKAAAVPGSAIPV